MADVMAALPQPIFDFDYNPVLNDDGDFIQPQSPLLDAADFPITYVPWTWSAHELASNGSNYLIDMVLNPILEFYGINIRASMEKLDEK